MKLEEIVEKLDESLLNNHRFDTPLFAKLTQIQREAGILHDDRPICPFLRPHFLARSKYDQIKSAVEELHLVFERLTEAALANNEIMSEINLTEKEERMARIEPRYKSLCVSSRFDIYLHGDDFKILEYNAETPAGVGDQLSFERVFEDVPEVQKFLTENHHWRPRPHIELLKALDLAYWQTGGKKEKPNIAIVDWEGVSTTAEFEILRDFWNTEGYQTIIANPFELDYDGEYLRVGDFEVDTFYKRVIIHEFLEHFDETHPLSRAYADGKVCMANSFRVKIPHKKTSFSILSDEKYAYLFRRNNLN
ncbi:MAG: glutathionylspermidine synthase family protein [Blastocatellia bacterium]|nr:glutathionylspermidine synthase family protein [Blastocatellia bacterium]